MKYLTASLVFALGLTVSAIAADKQTQTPISLFVKSAQANNGFSDPDKGRQDSIKDIKNKLEDCLSVRLVQSEAEAVIILEVLGREKKAGRSVMWGHKEETTVAVQITAGDFTAEFTGTSNSNKGWGVAGNYGRAAGEIVKQLDAWVKSNHDKLKEMSDNKAQVADSK